MDGGEKRGKVRQAYHEFLERFIEGLRMILLDDFKLVGQSVPHMLLVKFIRKHEATLERLELRKMNLPYIEHDDHKAVNQTHLASNSYWYNVIQACLPQLPPTQLGVKQAVVEHKELEYLHMLELKDGNMEFRRFIDIESASHVVINQEIRRVLKYFEDNPLSDDESEDADYDLEGEEDLEEEEDLGEEEELGEEEDLGEDDDSGEKDGSGEAEGDSEEEVGGANVSAAINTIPQHIRTIGTAADRTYTFMRY